MWKFSRKLKDKKEITDAYQRAVRNVPWSTQIWLNYLLSIERLSIDNHTEDTDRLLEKIFQSSLAEGGYSTAKECSSLWLCRIYQIKRGLDRKSEKDYSTLHKVWFIYLLFCYHKIWKD